MISKRNRLNEEEVVFVLKRGRLLRSDPFSFYFYKEKEQGLKIGIIISKKVAKTAVLRNRLKRITYDAILPTLEQTSFVGYLIIKFNRLPNNEELLKLKEDVLLGLSKING